MVKLDRFLVGLCGSMWVMGEWSVGQWIVGVISFQKMYGLYGLKHHTVEMSGDVTDPDGLGHFFREEFSKIKWAFA